MKKALLVVLAVLFLAPMAFAEDIHLADRHGPYDFSVHDHDDKDWVLGAKADAPNLIRLNDDWHIGVEGSKDFNHTAADEGWTGMAKITYSGTLINLGQ